ncbi:MAG: WYL domain-containing protein [Candidatus Zixiibacteriota bacterium]|nr:MAG: WYL domain-containing protein [candidate division Zixibacteria bacterium]
MTEPPLLSDFIASQVFVAFDTETTGMWAPINRIVEIGAVKFSLKSGVVDTFQTLVNPQRNIPDDVIEVHGITDEMVKHSPLIKPALERFMSFCGPESVLVAHNAPFDISFVGSELDRAGLEFGPNPILDTVDIYHRYFPGLASYSLLNLARQFELAQNQEHRALGDARLVYGLVVNAAPGLGEIENAIDLKNRLTTYQMESWQGEPVTLPDDFSDLQRAMVESLRVEIDYNHPVRASATRIIRPQQVFRLGSIFYINAYCEMARGERTFRLDRILRYKILADQNSSR